MASHGSRRMTREEREKHLDWLYRLKSSIFVFMPNDWIIPFADALDMAIKAVEQESRWIPVSERLPTKEEYIANNGLFIVSDGNRTCAEYFDVYNSMKYFGEPTMNGFRVDRCVTAWMPLPESYKGESER